MERASLRERRIGKRLVPLWCRPHVTLSSARPAPVPCDIKRNKELSAARPIHRLLPGTRVTMSDASHVYGPRKSETDSAYDPPLFYDDQDRYSYKLLPREWIQMHSKLKYIENKSTPVYLAPEDRIPITLPHSVQCPVRQNLNEGEFNLCSDNGIEVVEQILKVVATETQVSKTPVSQ